MYFSGYYVCGGILLCAVCVVCADFLMMWPCIFMYSQNSNDISMVNKIKIVIDYI